MPLHVSSTCAHHHEIKIVLYSLWYHHNYRWPSRAHIAKQPVHQTATYRCDDTRGCVLQLWLPDDDHMCSKHIEAWNKLTVKQKFYASSWLITEIINSTSFGQFLCPPSGIFHCTHSNVICHTGLLTWTIAVCTVRNSWLWTEELSLVCFIIRIFWCM